MDKVHRFLLADFAPQDVESLIDQSIDLTIATDVPTREVRLPDTPLVFRSTPVRRRSIPILPVISTRTFFHPIFQPLLDDLESTGTCAGHRSRAGRDERGGPGLRRLSHFVVEEQLDRMVIDNLGQPDGGALGSIPREGPPAGVSKFSTGSSPSRCLAPAAAVCRLRAPSGARQPEPASVPPSPCGSPELITAPCVATANLDPSLCSG